MWRSSVAARSSSTERVMRCMSFAPGGLSQASVRRRVDLVALPVAMDGDGADPDRDESADDDEAELVGVIVKRGDRIPERARRPQAFAEQAEELEAADGDGDDHGDEGNSEVVDELARRIRIRPAIGTDHQRTVG